MLGRSGEDITARYPEIATALRGLATERFVLDGEIVAYDASGRPSFGRLQKRMLLSRPRDIAAAMMRVPVRAVFFDCLALEGHDLRKLGLLDRKQCLGRILPPAGIIQAGDHVAEHGEAFFEAASEMGTEGARQPLGGAAARVRGALHRVDGRRGLEAPDLHRYAHGPEVRRGPARG